MKYNYLSFLFLTAIFFMGCGSTPKIIHKEYTYEKTLFGTHRINFDIHLENIGDSGKIYDLINNLIYKNKNFDQYRKYREIKFIENMREADYPPQVGEDGTKYFYHSELIEKYTVVFNSNAYIIVEYSEYLYNSGAAHGYSWFNYFIIDLKEERILDINDLMHPISDDVLKEIIQSNFNINYYLRENIWPPDTINFCNENITLIWNTYTITPYSDGIIYTEIPDEIIESYLTDKGKEIKSQL